MKLLKYLLLYLLMEKRIGWFLENTVFPFFDEESEGIIEIQTVMFIDEDYVLRVNEGTHGTSCF